MDISRLDYDLAPALIAQHPLARRDASRLMVVNRQTSSIEHCVFSDIVRYMAPQDALVLNDTRVKPVRLFARRASSAGLVEIFLLEPRGGGSYRAMTGSGGKLLVGERLKVNSDADGSSEVLLEVELLNKHDDGTWELRFRSSRSESVEELIACEARMPLPPYIKRDRFGDSFADDDKERYQTVFAKNEGAVAAPTAGLHFTPELLECLRGQGVESVFVTLHVGPGTFKPVKSECVEDHEMHSEAFDFPEIAAKTLAKRKAQGGRVVAVGTTAMRVLESCVDEDGVLCPKQGETKLMILPGYTFRAVDALLTNFHLPRSTLLALVMAFAGEELTRKAYQAAISEKYRFFSYGDAMLIV